MIRVLIVDDSPLMRRLLGGVLTAAGDFEVAYANNGVEALEQLHRFEPDVITLDVEMPEMDGLACLDRIMIDNPRPVVMVSSQTTRGAAATLQAMALGAVDFIPKPSGPMALEIDDLAPMLVEKIEVASKARLSRAHRLSERVRSRTARASVWTAPRTQKPRTNRPAVMPAFSATSGAVVVGSSTGGPPALEALLTTLPADFPLPILVAQHMPATFTGPLSRRLNDLSALSVVEVVKPIPLTPGYVYIGRGDADLIVGARPAGLAALPVPAKAEYRWHPSVDRLVDSAVAYIGAESLIGVLMTGMGNDGAAAMSRLSSLGGYTIAEAEETAVIWGMPGELVKAGGAKTILPLDEIGAFLTALTGQK